MRLNPMPQADVHTVPYYHGDAGAKKLRGGFIDWAIYEKNAFRTVFGCADRLVR